MKSFHPFLLICFLSTTTWAVQTEKFLNDNFSDFAEGEARGIAVTTDGFLKIGPSMEKWGDLAASTIWASVRGKDGNLFIASGNEGQIFKVDPNGKSTEFFRAKELQIQALALAPSGELYAGSMPDGKIYRIGGDGTSSIFFDPKEKYIWALQFDDQGNLFVATGDKGKLYKVSPSGKGVLFYDSDETHLRSLLLDREKRLWVGSEGTGLVYRFDQIRGTSSSPFVVYDSDFREIKAIVAAPDGSIFIGAMGDGKPANPFSANFKLKLQTTPMPLEPPSRTPSTKDENPSKTEEMPAYSESEEKLGAGEIVQILPNGSIERWWSDSEDIYCLAVPGKGRIWAGTGKKGKLLEITGAKQFSILGNVEAETINMLVPQGESDWLAIASNPGSIWKVSPTSGQRGSFESEVLDAQSSSRWGKLDIKTLPETGAVRVETRTGNTPKPDKVWSKWAPLKNESLIQSPLGRYIQYKAFLENDLKPNRQSGGIDSFAIYYQPLNQPPQISRIFVLAPNIELIKAPKMEAPLPPLNFAGTTQPPHPRKTQDAKTEEEAYAASNRTPMLQQVKRLGWRSLFWQTSDPNGDELHFDVLYRQAGSDHWELLKGNLNEPFFSWDAATWPDGEYYAKVVATDQPSNLPGEGLTDELSTNTFIVDHTAPSIEIDTAPKKIHDGYISVLIQDSTSIVDEAEYSVDGSDWLPLLPIHGIYDSRSSEFRIPTGKLTSGEHHLSIRASDAANNIASQSIRFQKEGTTKD